jgi:hypothetical protein
LLVGGFFLEAGAANGEKDSDSLHFELNRGWTVRRGEKENTFGFAKVLPSGRNFDRNK